MDAMVRPTAVRFIPAMIYCGDPWSMNLSSLLKRSGRQGTRTLLFLHLHLTSSDTAYWIPVLPHMRQTGTTNPGSKSVSRLGTDRNYEAFSAAQVRLQLLNRTAVGHAMA